MFCYLSLPEGKQEIMHCLPPRTESWFHSAWRQVEDVGEGIVLLLKKPKYFRLLPGFKTH